MRLPLLDQADTKSIDIETVKKMVDAFLAAGFSYFDTAACYHDGQSEIAFREAVVKRYPREKFTITDKLAMFMLEKPEEMPGFFAGQLERLGVDYIDYYWLHGLDPSSYEKAEAFGAFEFVHKLKAEGKVHHLGFSFHGDAALLETILTKHPEMEIVQLQLNYLDWDDAQVQSRLCYEVAARHGKPVVVMEPVKGGALATIPEPAEKLLKAYNPDASTASWAVRFAATPENIMVVLSGMSSEAQMADNLSYMQDFQPISAEEQAVIDEAKTIIQQTIAIPCTACRYCVDGCHSTSPSQIILASITTSNASAHRSSATPAIASASLPKRMVSHPTASAAASVKHAARSIHHPRLSRRRRERIGKLSVQK